MKQLTVIPLILLGSFAAQAQSTPQPYPIQQQQQASVEPYGAPHYYPPQGVQPAQPTQQVPTNEPRAGEYGQSVMTDIRQMNF